MYYSEKYECYIDETDEEILQRWEEEAERIDEEYVRLLYGE